MKARRVPNYLVAGALLLSGGSIGFLFAHFGRAPSQERNITITARKYAYDPPVIEVNQGDRLRIRLVAKDVTHGFYVEGYDIDAKMRPDNPTFWLRHPSSGGETYQEAAEISFVANHAGKFHYRCSITCGYMHPFMQGELIVRPNYLYSISLGSSIALMASMLVIFRRAPAGGVK